jgi:hypothetical protein
MNPLAAGSKSLDNGVRAVAGKNEAKKCKGKAKSQKKDAAVKALKQRSKKDSTPLCSCLRNATKGTVDNDCCVSSSAYSYP